MHTKSQNEDQKELFDKIAANTLAVPYTWKTELSALGQQPFESGEAKAAAFKDKWEELIDSGKLGDMALLRNLRNILQAEVSPAHMRKVCSFLADPKAVQKAKQLPFRFLAAFRELKEQPRPA